MCGIAGKFSFRGQPIDQGLLEHMGKLIAHRGPDDVGYYCQGSVGLVHRRLSIIDLSPAGHQPMSTPDGKIWIVFNGEIYNYQELRQPFVDQGYPFRSHSDTEVILALYEKYGEACLQYLRGMFAFALWDTRQEKLFIARDRLGKKPLKYYVSDNEIVFASELKALFADPVVPRQVDERAIYHYLSFQYVPGPLTGFQGIAKLPPAHYLVAHKGKVDVKRYWQLSYAHQVQRPEEEWTELIRRELRESVRLRMIADVPLGAFLSGGVDSSAVVAMMAEQSSRPVKTFSIGFPEASHNELEYARMIAQRFGTDHTEFIVEPKALEVLPKLIHHYEEPYADSSAVPTYYVSQLTRQHVTVVLNGDGGDENFAGYGRYQIHQFASAYDRVPAFLREGLIRPGAGWLAKILKTTLTDRANRFAMSMAQGPARRYLDYICYFNEAEKHQLLNQEYLRRLANEDSRRIVEGWFAQVDGLRPIDQALAVDIMSYLPDDLLVKVDIASMAVSLEGRSPLLDHRLMEMAATIPSSLKIRGREKKYIFKKALSGILPDDVLYRPKMGFGVPIEHWFRHELKDYIRDQLLSSRMADRGLFNMDHVRRYIDEHQHTRVNHAHRLWALLTLELWFQEYIDAPRYA